MLKGQWIERASISEVSPPRSARIDLVTKADVALEYSTSPTSSVHRGRGLRGPLSPRYRHPSPSHRLGYPQEAIMLTNREHASRCAHSSRCSSSQRRCGPARPGSLNTPLRPPLEVSSTSRHCGCSSNADVSASLGSARHAVQVQIEPPTLMHDDASIPLLAKSQTSDVRMHSDYAHLIRHKGKIAHQQHAAGDDQLSQALPSCKTPDEGNAADQAPSAVENSVSAFHISHPQGCEESAVNVDWRSIPSDVLMSVCSLSIRTRLLGLCALSLIVIAIVSTPLRRMPQQPLPPSSSSLAHNVQLSNLPPNPPIQLHRRPVLATSLGPTHQPSSVFASPPAIKKYPSPPPPFPPLPPGTRLRASVVWTLDVAQQQPDGNPLWVLLSGRRRSR